MTQVIFDVVDLVGEVHPGDTVSVWPPYVASTVDGRVRSTRKIDVLVDEGPVTEDIEPGPLVVQLQCRGIADTKPRTVTIPDDGTITLANLLQSTFTYTPAVVSQVSLGAQRAEDAAVRAEAGAAVVGDAQTVLTARDQAVTAAEDAEQIATALQSELDTRVPPLVADAIAAEPTIVDAAAAAVGPLAQGAVDAALAGSQHYSGTGFPNGVVTAPVGSIYTDTAATAGAIRWVKASGTGKTGWKVQYGDTGWRNVTTLLLPGWAGSLHIARNGAEVTLSGTNLRPPSTGNVGIMDLPEGFRPSRTTVGTGEETGVLRPVFALSYSPFQVEMRAIAAAQSWANFTISFTVSNPWPTTLPGIPT